MGPIKENILKVYGRDPTSLDELAQCVMAVINNQENRDPWYNQRKNSKPREFEKFKIIGFAWSLDRNELVSNSHSNPEGCPSNWGCKDDLPKGYPGWSGRVWIRYEEEPYSFNASGVFAKTCTYTGTGGGGSYSGFSEAVSSARWERYGHKSPHNTYPAVHNFSWDYRFFDLDWPALAREYEKLKVVQHLGGPAPFKHHRFEWQDPLVVLRDQEFLADCAIHRAKMAKKVA